MTRIYFQMMRCALPVLKLLWQSCAAPGGAMAGCKKNSLNMMILLGFVLATVRPIRAAGLSTEASRAFDLYVQNAEQRMQGELHSGSTFLRIDGLTDASRQDAYARLNRGEVVTEQIASGQVQTPGALIHHWVGTVFIPGATMKQVLAVVQEYDHHSDYYSPQVQKSKLLAHSGDDFTIYMRLAQKHLITVVFDTEHEAHYTTIDAAHVYSHSHARRIAEVSDPGSSSEHDLPPGDDHGFLWRLESYWRFYDSGHGVYVQCEAISLTRDVPLGLGWMISPFIESVPRESLEFTLGSTRSAVLRSLSQRSSAAGDVARPVWDAVRDSSN
jgi:hypothetical protein